MTLRSERSTIAAAGGSAISKYRSDPAAASGQTSEACATMSRMKTGPKKKCRNIEALPHSVKGLLPMLLGRTRALRFSDSFLHQQVATHRSA